jgi:hypothetical protein
MTTEKTILVPDFEMEWSNAKEAREILECLIQGNFERSVLEAEEIRSYARADARKAYDLAYDKYLRTKKGWHR